MGHLKDVNETYFEHFRQAFEVGSVLLLASLAQIVHAVVPGFCPPYGSDIGSLIKFLESKLPENRK
jgi:hypothetical protein